MPVFNAKFHTFDFDAGKVSKTMDEQIKRQIRMAARAFASVMVRLIPVRTGFARGTVRNIYEATGASGGATERSLEMPADLMVGFMRFMKHNELTGNISPSKHPNLSNMFKITKGTLTRATEGGFSAEYYRDGKRRILKTPQSGRQFATPSSQIIGSSGMGIYTFNFSVAISYFNINDFYANKNTPSSPWKAFQTAQATAFNYLKTQGLPKLPKITDFLVEYEVNVTGASVSKKKLGVINRNTRFKF